MRTEINITIFDVIIFLGVFQGLLLSWFFIINYRGSRRYNLFQGFLLIAMSLAIFEEWLNNTGFIVRVLYLTNFSESLNFVFAPLLYLYIRSSLKPESNKNTLWHFIPFFFWTIYMVFQFVQPDDAKYNSYLQTKHPDWASLPHPESISDDPLGIRTFVNQLMLFQLVIYILASSYALLKKFRELSQPLFKTDNTLLKTLRNTIIQFLILILLITATKLYFGMRSDIGGNIVGAYVSLLIYITTWRIMKSSDYFESPGSFLSFPALKYQKSSLSEEDKLKILARIKHEMEVRKYFTSNLASLSGLSKQINESSHHVSQVMNEKMNKSFFELLAFYRVEYAKKLIRQDKDGKITIEELAEMVGYNSKSSFNTVFRKYTSMTPSEFRKSPDV